MSEQATVETPVVTEVPKTEPPKVSPAKDLREIQALLANGIFPGNVAPTIVKAYNLLEQMAQVVERESAKQENPA